MAENSKIEWCHHTFNPWIGCAKISPGCANCYASVETFTRVERGKGRKLWGVDAERHITGEDNWRKPVAWNKKAAALNERHRVFCASLADVFEDRDDLIDARHRLMLLIEATPSLDWLLLTKRPENIGEMVPVKWFGDGFPLNLWLGTSVENQEQADKRIPELLQVPAAVRFLSCEPLLGPIEFSNATHRSDWASILGKPALFGIHWVIVGGESGPNARPMYPDWARSLRDQCQVVGVAFFFKQWGEHVPTAEYRDDKVFMNRVGKKAAGRLLDDREWNEFPNAKIT